MSTSEGIVIADWGTLIAPIPFLINKIILLKNKTIKKKSLLE
jgi:hypothetical protein